MKQSFFAKLFGRSKTAPEPEEAEEQIPERIGDREPSFKYATIKLQSGARLKAIAVDLDSHGMRARFLSKESLSDIVHVSVNGVCSQQLARVAWRDQKDAGLQFIG
ncbi:MAG: hypothetical protein AAGK23_04700 [Pseudomonadota bacterium]